MAGIKGPKNKDIISKHTSISEPHCGQWKEDILFEFGHMTTKKEHSFQALHSHNQKIVVKAFIKLIHDISQFTWTDLKKIGKKQHCGYNMMELATFWEKPNDVYFPDMSGDTKLYVFRFATKYRMVGCKSPNCSRTFHVLGFDLDKPMYDHGR